MKFDPHKCPGCGGNARGTLDNITGTALMYLDVDGEYEWLGETEVDWDSQESDVLKGKVNLQCADCRGWWRARKIDS